MTTVEFSNQLIGLEDNLKRFAMILTLNDEDANDLVQDTFLRALNYRDRYMESPYKNLKGWAYAIMKSIFINNYRKNVSRKNNLGVAEQDTNVWLKEDSPEANPETKLQLRELELAIGHLNMHLRTPFLMYISGFKYKEIAVKLGIKHWNGKKPDIFARKVLKRFNVIRIGFLKTA
ncbi:MAG: RNA polymerase sigma factor [Bacteroidales bacterium]|nr:RNA polymerase sigma factor [Bacteroidales bacterium]